MAALSSGTMFGSPAGFTWSHLAAEVLDGWSLLWYQPWASGAGRAASIWHQTARRMDWRVYANGPAASSADE